MTTAFTTARTPAGSEPAGSSVAGSDPPAAGQRAGRPQTGLADFLREATRDLHTAAERSGVIRQMLRGEIAIGPYVLFLRNLLPVYQAMEARLVEIRARSPQSGVARLAISGVFRAPALESDLAAIAGASWADLPCLRPTSRYVASINAAAGGDGSRLVAHAYTRYLGDLSGGQILSRTLRKALNLGDSQLNFYSFGETADVAKLRDRYRQAIDTAGRVAPDMDGIAREARGAFQHNIDLSEAVPDPDRGGRSAGGTGRSAPQ